MNALDRIEIIHQQMRDNRNQYIKDIKIGIPEARAVFNAFNAFNRGDLDVTADDVADAWDRYVDSKTVKSPFLPIGPPSSRVEDTLMNQMARNVQQELDRQIMGQVISDPHTPTLPITHTSSSIPVGASVVIMGDPIDGVTTKSGNTAVRVQVKTRPKPQRDKLDPLRSPFDDMFARYDK